jgi:hypothetical protein
MPGFHESFGIYSSPRVHDDLVEWGYIISQKTVARIMKELSFKATPKEKFVVTTDSNHDLGWDSRRVRTSHSLVARLGGLKVTLVFKRRQLGDGLKAKWLKGYSSIMFVIRDG